MTADEIRAILRRRQDGLVRHDPSAVAAEYAEGCVVESPLFGTVIGRDAVEAMHRTVDAWSPDVHREYTEPLIVGNQAVQTLMTKGIDTGGLFGQAPTQKPFRFFMVYLLVLEHGKIIHERRVYDVNGLLLQLGSDSAITDDAPQSYNSALARTKLEHEVQTAAAIQQALLPEREHRRSSFEVAAASVPCRAIGGDFFDYFDLQNGNFGFAVGDVAGKGPPAALLAAQVQGILAAQAQNDSSPSSTLTNVNRVLARRAVEARFVTMMYGALSDDGVLTYCNAGHNPPLLVRRDAVERLHTGGLVLGLFGAAAFEQDTRQLETGDFVVVFSDGVTEAMNAASDEFGEERLLACAQHNRGLSACAFLNCLFDAVSGFSAGAAPNDDRTAMVLRYTGM